MICSICKTNIAVIFINKFEDGKSSLEGLCLSCAKKQGIEPINQILQQSGLTSEEIDENAKQLEDILTMSNTDVENLKAMPGEKNIFDFFNNLFHKAEDEKGNSFTTPTPPSNDSSKEKSTRTKINDKKIPKKKKFLDTFGTNLNEMAKNNKIDNIIGRKKEIERVIEILNRRTKNNPVLIGEPGVGKSAIAEGLACKIVQKDVPVKLLNYEVYQVDMTAMIAGTQFRGQFESRMKGLIDEVKSFGNIILVIDELHNIMGAGDAEGAMSAANILKPALSHGEVQIIGATTLKEYRKYIEKDSALERRFQSVIVEEPTIEDSIEILKGIKKYYEDYHKVKIPDEIVEACVKLSSRYINDRFLPDKAIDVLDEAASRANLMNANLVKLDQLNQELKQIQEDKETAISADSIEDYQKAADLKTHECHILNEIQIIEEENKDYSLTVENIAGVIERWTKIPVQKITEQESEKLLNLENVLHQRIVGQDEAVSAVAKSIRRRRTGLRNRRRPPSFIFVGPTGVGKTELARTIANELFGSEDYIIRLDMSEYMEKHTVSKLIGAPPGYVGYDEAGQLTEKVRRKPYSIILLDEIEKAHPDVFNMLLQILEDGRLTDSQGRTVNFDNTVIIMTSNAGSNLNNTAIGFNSSQNAISSKIDQVLKETFRPEFLNRVDDVIIFKQLSKDELMKIIDIMLIELGSELSNQKIALILTEAAKEFILNKGYNSKFGARPLRRTIQKEIEDVLAEMILRGEVAEGANISVDCFDNNLVFNLN